MNSEGGYAFYGSLREGLENYALYRDDLGFLETVELCGFKMDSLGDYPYVVQTGDFVDSIVVDLLTITNQQHNGSYTIWN